MEQALGGGHTERDLIPGGQEGAHRPSGNESSAKGPPGIQHLQLIVHPGLSYINKEGGGMLLSLWKRHRPSSRLWSKLLHIGSPHSRSPELHCRHFVMPGPDPFNYSLFSQVWQRGSCGPGRALHRAPSLLASTAKIA